MERQRAQLSDLFGMSQAIILFSIIAMTAAFAVILLRSPLEYNIYKSIQDIKWIPVFLLVLLWGGELYLYFMTVEPIAKGPTWVTPAGIGITLAVRLLTTGLAMRMLPAPSDYLRLFHAEFAHLLTIPAGYLALRYALLPLIAGGFGQAEVSHGHKRHHTPAAPVPPPPPNAQPSRYAFNAAQRVAPPPVISVKRETQAPEPKTVVGILPPTGFVVQPPVPGVYETVSVPRDIILKSIPEIAVMLSDSPMINLPLSHLIPQLGQSSAWLPLHTFVKLNDVAMTTEEESEFGNRWVKIAARHIALQVPPQYFVRQAPRPCRWMTLPEVEQEKDFALEQGA